MKNNNLKLLIFSFLAIFTIQVVGAYTTPSCGPTSKCIDDPMNVTTTDNYKYSGLGVKEFISGTAGTIAIDQSGNTIVNSATAQNDVRLYVEGSIKIKDLAGSGTRRICSSKTGSSNEGYPLVICP
ncbi:hypothetical protein IT400_02270 [Candidatus Nomurabacteria bacterium]|nr:hypothetical protein [Candidatus Nomurabacteria bacterium]